MWFFHTFPCLLNWKYVAMCPTCTGEVATVLCEFVPWFELEWPVEWPVEWPEVWPEVWPAAWSEQQWKSHSLEVGEPRLCEVTGWWRRAWELPAHSTVCVCTVELSIELPCRDSCRGEGAPLIMGRDPRTKVDIRIVLWYLIIIIT